MIKMPGSSSSGGLFGSSLGGNLLSAAGKLTESVMNEPIKKLNEGLAL